MALYTNYVNSIRDEFGYVATWLPSQQLAVGDVCLLDDGQVRRRTTLESKGIAFATRLSDVETTFTYSSSDSVEVSLKAEGEPPPLGSALQLADAGAVITFGTAGSVYFALNDCTSTELEDVDNVGRQILELHKNGDWNEDYFVVIEVVQAGGATIAISKGANGSLELTANAGINQLANLAGNVSVRAESKLGFRAVAEPGLTPLVRIAGVRRRFLGVGRPQFRGAAQGDYVFRPTDYEDYE